MNRKELFTLCLITVLLSSSGCSKNNNEIPDIHPISDEYYEFDEYYKYTVINGEAVKNYKAENIFLLYNKDTYEVNEYIYVDRLLATQLYDLETEELLVHSNNLTTTYNEEYYNYLVDNTYHVYLPSIGDYVEGEQVKEYYTLDEIKELEPKILEGLKIINKEKNKTLVKQKNT